MSELEDLIHSIIARDGPIPFAHFMSLALYHPELGYYTGGRQGREPLGWTGDYLTSGDLHPLWGWAVARQLHQMWELLGRPVPFDVLEPGAGRGLLAYEVWCYARQHAPDWFAALRYTLVDRAPANAPLRVARERRLREALVVLDTPPEATRWASDIPEIFPTGTLTGVVVSNELVDALPTHVVEISEGALREVYVATDAAGRLIETLGPLSASELATYLDDFHIPWRRYPEGWRCEICLAAAPWMREIARTLRRGFALTIDYGDTARRLYTRYRRHGTLAVYRRHALGARALANPGSQDLTAHVNFSALITRGREGGLRLAGLTTQSELLQRLGVYEQAEALGRRLYPAADTERHTDRGQADHLRRRMLQSAVAALLNPGGLGGFRVLLQQCGVPGSSRLLLGLRAS